MRRYVHSAIKVFTLEHEADDMNHKIYAAVANMYGKFGITPEDLHKANNSEHHGFQEGHVGTTIKHFTETIEKELFSVLYGWCIHQPWKKRISGDIIDVLRMHRRIANGFNLRGITIPKMAKVVKTARVNGIDYSDSGKAVGNFFNEELLKLIKRPEYSELDNIIKEMNGQVQFNNKEYNASQRKKQVRKFWQEMSQKNMYSGLSLLYNKCHEAMGCRDVSDFIKYLFTNKHGKTWINALCLAKCVKYQTLIKWYQNKIDEERMEAGSSYVEKNEIESPGAMGVYNDLKMDAMIARVIRLKGTTEWLPTFSRLAFFYLEKIFRPRPTTIYTFRIMSERDYAALQRKSCSEGYKSLLWGLFLIVTEHGFRWEKRESKTRHGNSKKKDYGDFILKTKSDLDKYPFLYEMSHMFCEAFTMTSPFAYKLTHDSM